MSEHIDGWVLVVAMAVSQHEMVNHTDSLRVCENERVNECVPGLVSE